MEFGVFLYSALQCSKFFYFMELTLSTIFFKYKCSICRSPLLLLITRVI